MQKVHKPYLSVHFERRYRKTLELLQNVKVCNIHQCRATKSYSIPHEFRFPTRFHYSGSPHRVKRELTRKMTRGENQRRRSCDCVSCGSRTVFQKETIQVQVAYHTKLEQQKDRFQRSPKKQLDKLFLQSLNTQSGPLDEADSTKYDFVINSFENVQEIPSQPLTQRGKERVGFFDSYLQKQQHLIMDQRKKFIIHHKQLESKILFRSIPDLPKISPRIVASMMCPTQAKKKNNIYLQHSRHKLTRSEVPHQLK